ncbi:hypothetical protein PHLCEN_2v1510 [Hermanssonia centrifuga]|uniref:Glycoside hydrolase family 3 protein n=1 Tax=Hermanssonia centrifuga TaxID=98765 RepID=A0A2R6RZX0_9APHY|nr:hypothetical protein PHLCEN_2v1510 [Hermanssonia centrifuga]
MFAKISVLLAFLSLSLRSIAKADGSSHVEVRDDLHFPFHARATNNDGSLPVYKNSKSSIEDRVNDLLPRMTLDEKVAQLIQGDIDGWMDMSDPLDDTLMFNQTGLEQMMAQKAGAIWGGYLAKWDKIVFAITVGQKYLMENTTLGIPALFQTEGLHGFTDNGTIWPSPIGLAASFNTDLLQQAAATIADEAEGLGYSQVFAPVLDLSRELRWGRVEENFGEDPFLTGEMGHAYVTGLQAGRRRNASSTAIARMASTCKHFAAFGSPQGGLNIAQVSGGERELRTMFLKPFNRACVESLAIMTAYSSYDGIPAVANTRTSDYHLDKPLFDLIGSLADLLTDIFGDYVFFNASLNGISPLAGFTQFLSNTSTKINYADGSKLWSNDESEIPAAVSAAQSSDVAIVMVGTWSLDQTLLWTPGTNATTGEHVDLSDLGLVGAQLKLVQAVKATGKPTVVVLVSGKPVAEPWIQANADAVIQQFYPGELGGLALAEVVFGAVNPSGKLPVSFPRNVGTTPVFYNYIKGSRPLDPGSVLDDGTLVFGHQASPPSMAYDI